MPYKNAENSNFSQVGVTRSQERLATSAVSSECRKFVYGPGSHQLNLNFCFTSLLLHLGLLFGYKLSSGYIVMINGILP